MTKLENFKNITGCKIGKLEKINGKVGGKIRIFEKYGDKIEKYKGKIGKKIEKWWENWKSWEI